MVSKFLAYPFILMIILDIFAFGSTQATFGANGVANVNRNSNINTTSISPPLTCIGAAAGSFIDFVYNFLTGTQCPQIAQNPGSALPSGLSGVAFYANPFGDPLGFVATILIILGVITLGGTAIFGTSFLNAGTAYILFITISLILTWTALLTSGASVFQTFPCYNSATSQLLFSCPSNAGAFPINGNVVFTGYLFEFILSLSVFIGIVDMVAL